MEKEIIEKYERAGRICAEVMEELKAKVRPGVKIIDVAKTGEELITRKGGGITFPINISINEFAAHYTPRFGDTREVSEGELVKIDVGVHIDGYIADSAFTYCSENRGRNYEMIKCAEKAVEEVIKILRPGVRINEIGQFIESLVEKNNFSLIANLTGHGLEQYVGHATPTIPNIKNNNGYELKEGDVIAIEPFVTPSRGFVKDTSITEIYNYMQDRPVRLPEARKILEMARDDYHGLPFAKRWLLEKFSPIKVSLALRELEAVNAIGTHPVLREADNKPSAQAEHTIIIMEKPIVITKNSD